MHLQWLRQLRKVCFIQKNEEARAIRPLRRRRWRRGKKDICYVGKSHNRRFPVTRRISHSLRLIHRLLVSHVSLTGFGAPTATNTSPGMEMHGYKYRPQGPCGNLIIRDMTSGAASLPTRTETPRAGFLGGRETSTPIDLSIWPSCTCVPRTRLAPSFRAVNRESLENLSPWRDCCEFGLKFM